MTTLNLLLFFLASFGISLALFFSLVLFRLKKTAPYSNQILALLLFFLSLRIGKSVFYNFVELPLFVKNIGLACNLAVGPLLLLYGKSLYEQSFRFYKSQLLHFIPSAIFLLFCTVIPNGTNSQGWYVGYSLVLVQSFVYVFLSLKLRRKQPLNGQPNPNRWYFYLTLGLAAMWIVYLLIFLKIIPIYLAGSFSFTLLVGILGYLGLKEKQVFIDFFTKKYSSSSLDPKESHHMMKKVRSILEREQLFLHPKLSLKWLADKTGTNGKTLSQVINENTGRNFSYFINSYRIDYAQQLFSNPDTNEEKIITIAYESGFNSLSSFNAVFKQHTAMTPSEFRQKQSTNVPQNFIPSK